MLIGVIFSVLKACCSVILLFLYHAVVLQLVRRVSTEWAAPSDVDVSTAVDVTM